MFKQSINPQAKLYKSSESEENNLALIIKSHKCFALGVKSSKEVRIRKSCKSFNATACKVPRSLAYKNLDPDTILATPLAPPEFEISVFG